MTSLSINKLHATWFGRPFYLIMSLVMAAVIVASFYETGPNDFTSNPGRPLLLHIHGAVFTL